MDIDQLLARVDVTALVDRVDINEVAQRLDIDALAAQTDLGAVIARSSGGIAADALDVLRSQAVGLDEFIARWVGRLRRRRYSGPPGPPERLRASGAAADRGPAAGHGPGGPGPGDRHGAAVTAPPVARLSFQGRFAGAASRFAAYVIDIGVSTGVFVLAVAGASFVASVIMGHSVSWNRTNIIVEILYFLWLFIYFAYSWAASGKTFGMAMLGVRVLAADGADATARQAVVRTLAFPLSFLLFGLGFIGIVLQRDRRALHDLIAGTAVIYDWDARAARLRFLARDNRRSELSSLA